MRKGGLEPPRDCSHKLLRLARLPIPPLPRGVGQPIGWRGTSKYSRAGSSTFVEFPHDELITHTKTSAIDRAFGHFHHRERAERGSHACRYDAASKFGDAAVARREDHVDGEAHAERM